jgi:hypothetical protein
LSINSSTRLIHPALHRAAFTPTKSLAIKTMVAPGNFCREQDIFFDNARALLIRLGDFGVFLS